MNDFLQRLQIVAISVNLRCQLLSRNLAFAVFRLRKAFEEGCFSFRIRNENISNERVRAASAYAKTREKRQRKRLAGGDRSRKRNDTHDATQPCSSVAAIVLRRSLEMSGTMPNHFSNETAAWQTSIPTPPNVGMLAFRADFKNTVCDGL